MTTPTVTRTTVLDQTLPSVLKVSRVEVRRIVLAPSVVGGAHIHNGPVFGSIESGSVIFQIGDETEVVLRANDTFYEPANALVSKFDATAEGVTFLGYFLVGADESPEIDFVGPADETE
jgi:mannose-6-phosphate isomerase-like protein (cupin superfamily)